MSCKFDSETICFFGIRHLTYMQIMEGTRQHPPIMLTYGLQGLLFMYLVYLF